MNRPINKAVLLAAGRGTRMRDLTNELPKPMIVVRGKPILQHIIEGLRAAGVTQFLLIVGYRAEVFRQTFRDGALFGATAKEAFYVRIDETLNPPSTRKLGRLYIEIGVQPVYPAEFIVVRIGIWDGGNEVAEV